mgnify:CR=1 FL=1|jgi:CRP/FNR family transcriptional regulator, cyclic AMP receptor protein
MKETFVEWIRKVPIFRSLNDEQLLNVASIGEEISYSDGEVIFETNDEADALYIIKEGSIQIEQVHTDGRRKTLAVLTRENFFGEMAIITGGTRCATATCGLSCTLIRIEKSAFLGLLGSNASLSLGILLVICGRLQSADREIGTLTFQNLPGRVAQKLFELASQFGRLDAHGLTIQLSLTHYDLADMVGTNRESISKYLAKFRKEGSISIHQKRITILDRSKLLAWT